MSLTNLMLWIIFSFFFVKTLRGTLSVKRTANDQELFRMLENYQTFAASSSGFWNIILCFFFFTFMPFGKYSFHWMCVYVCTWVDCKQRVLKINKTNFSYLEICFLYNNSSKDSIKLLGFGIFFIYNQKFSSSFHCKTTAFQVLVCWWKLAGLSWIIIMKIWWISYDSIFHFSQDFQHKIPLNFFRSTLILRRQWQNW